MSNCREKILRPLDITVVAGTSTTITVPDVFLHNREHFTMPFCLTEAEVVKLLAATGTEPVLIQVGVGGTVYPLIDNAGNIFYTNKLLLGFKYRLRWGNNGLPAAIAHFINLNTPCCSRGIDPANAAVTTG